MPLLLSTNYPTGRTKGRRETGEPFRETHLEVGAVQILLVPSCVAPRFAVQVAEPSGPYVLFRFLERNLRSIFFLTSLSLFSISFIPCVLNALSH